ncbi:hypothetical protein [Amycolatopsis sp. lyj-108]|uniref:hypothetical protein n=1 Tax=Amycolatopsis sp. lyj-108 TaxID=2789286 RepID=UPI0039786952
MKAERGGTTADGEMPWKNDLMTLAKGGYISLVEFVYVSGLHGDGGQKGSELAEQRSVQFVTGGLLGPGFVQEAFSLRSATAKEPAERIGAYIDRLLQAGGLSQFGEPCWFDLPVRSSSWGHACSPDNMSA